MIKTLPESATTARRQRCAPKRKPQRTTSTHTRLACKANCWQHWRPIDFLMRTRSTNRAVETILKTALTDKIGDGKIFTSKIDEAIRIRNKSVAWRRCSGSYDRDIACLAVYCRWLSLSHSFLSPTSTARVGLHSRRTSEPRQSFAVIARSVTGGYVG